MRVFSMGFDLALLERRNRALLDAGYEVESAQSAEQARAACDGEYDAAVFGHRVPVELRNEIAGRIRKANPGVKIVMIYRGATEHAELASAVLSAGDPQRIVEALRLLLQRNAAAS
jgi:DNA-binding response OmpR family regulator